MLDASCTQLFPYVLEKRKGCETDAGLQTKYPYKITLKNKIHTIHQGWTTWVLLQLRSNTPEPKSSGLLKSYKQVSLNEDGAKLCRKMDLGGQSCPALHYTVEYLLHSILKVHLGHNLWLQYQCRQIGIWMFNIMFKTNYSTSIHFSIFQRTGTLCHVFFPLSCRKIWRVVLFFLQSQCWQSWTRALMGLFRFEGWVQSNGTSK